MEIEINVSKIMTASGQKENRIVRLPEKAAEQLKVKFGEFLNFRHRTGEVMALQVEALLAEDQCNQQPCAYVTQSTHNKLFIRNRGARGIASVEEITLGCDPEAFLIDVPSNKVMAAHRFFNKNGGVGNDGLLLEFRPMPHTDADVVCRNIWALIQEARKILNMKGVPNTIMWASSAIHNLTAGFHLHYGLPKGLLLGRSGTPGVAALMTTAFDYYVGIPSIIPEGNEDFTRRTQRYVNYGKPGGFRLNTRTFEFRLPGGTNLRHPILTEGLLSLGAIVAEDVARRINTCTDCFENLSEINSMEDLLRLYPELPDAETSYRMICNPDISLARSHLDRIKDGVRQMFGYEKRKHSVENYFHCIEDGTNFSNNIEINWEAYHGGNQQG